MRTFSKATNKKKKRFTKKTRYRETSKKIGKNKFYRTEEIRNQKSVINRENEFVDKGNILSLRCVL